VKNAASVRCMWLTLVTTPFLSFATCELYTQILAFTVFLVPFGLRSSPILRLVLDLVSTGVYLL